MSLAAWRKIALALTLSFAAMVAGGADPQEPKAKPADSFPPGTIYVIGADAKEVVNVPGAVILTPEKYRELINQIEQLKRGTTPEKPDPPSICRLSFRIDGNTARAQLHYKFETDQPGRRIQLGGQRPWPLWPTAISLDDGRLPALAPPGEQGFILPIDRPGVHQLSMEADVPVQAKGSEQGLDVGLPGAAITLLEEVHLPAGVREVRVLGYRGTDDKRPFSRTLSADALKGPPNPRAVALGPISRLELVWKGPTPSQPGQPLRTAQGQISVQVDDTQVLVHADLTLRVLRGQVNDWRVQVPGQAAVEARSAANDELTPVLSDPKNFIWVIRLPEATSEPVRVQVRLQLTRSDKPVAVGPFYVLGAARQHGSISISAPNDVRLRYQLRGDVAQREPPDDERGDFGPQALFHYWSLPSSPGPAPPPAPLEFTIEPAKGAVETRLFHHLQLTRNGWRLSTRIDVVPVRTSVDRLEMELPEGCPDLKVGTVSGSIAEDIEFRPGEGGHRLATVRLVQRQSRPFSVTLEALYPGGPGHQAVLALPRPSQTQDGGAQVRVSVPEGYELLLARDPHATAELEALTPGQRNQGWQSDQAPVQVELSWQRYRPALPVHPEVDLTFSERQGMVRTVIPWSAEMPRQLVLKMPAVLASRTPLVRGGTLTLTDTGQAVLAPDDAGNGTRVSLEYGFPLPEPERESRLRRVTVPLIWPEQATQCITKVRVWADPGVLPELVASPWDEQPLERVPDRDRLPALVLRGTGIDLPLTFRLHEPTLAPLATFVIDRVLVQARLDDSGEQTFRARFLLTRLSNRFLDLEFPASPASVNASILLDGKVVTRQLLVDEQGRPAETGRILRLEIDPAVYRPPVVLDVHCQVMAKADHRPWAPWRTVLTPPQVRGSVFLGRIRWQVGLSGGWLPLHVGGGGVPELAWGWRNGLLYPEASATDRELEHWFMGTEPSDDAAGAAARPSLVCWQTALEPLAVVQVPQQAWLLMCSLLVLIVGLGLYFAPVSRLFVRAGIVLLAGALAAFGVVWPSTFPMVVYGCEPGVAVLVLVLGVQWALQQRYRRQLMFMPGFTRLKGGSSLIRGGAAARSTSEPSTVDALPPGSGHGG
ncbi:MAG: hypothetical protein NZ700_09705 [Gemmataceae bacterium]|nr:hypothetical protein [Gemmataceae bacterium]MDW8266896.1 hypothetical protein [Gemmataceae bacterium]